MSKSEGQIVQVTYSCPTRPGEKIMPVHTRVYDEELKKEVVKKTSETDVYDLIQEANNTSDITLFKKMINGGQMEPPEDPVAQYGLDLGNFPSSIHEVYDRVNDGENAFNSLPQFIQDGFGSYEAMTQALLNGTYGQKLDDFTEAYVKQKQAEAAAAAPAGGDN